MSKSLVCVGGGILVINEGFVLWLHEKVDTALKDYKIFCFDGKPQWMFIASDRDSGHPKFDYYDMEFNHLDIAQKYPHASKSLRKPATFETMIHLAEELSKGIPHVRVDFYEVDDKTYFGELTFYHFSGFMPFNPAKWDKTFGDRLKLPTNKGN